MSDDSDGLGARPEECLSPAGVEVGVQMSVDDPLVADHIVVAATEGRYDTDSGKALGQIGQDIGDAVPYSEVSNMGDPPEPQGQHHVDGDNGQ